MTVEVRVSDTEWHLNEISSGTEVLRRLRNAGVPVIGNIWPHGVERGRLITTTDTAFGEYVFTWEDE